MLLELKTEKTNPAQAEVRQAHNHLPWLKDNEGCRSEATDDIYLVETSALIEARLMLVSEISKGGGGIGSTTAAESPSEMDITEEVIML